MDKSRLASLDHLKWWERLSTRLTVSVAVALAIFLTMIGSTLWLSWQMEGAAAAINDAGTLRMRANQVALSLEALSNDPTGAATERLERQLHRQAFVLQQLRKGDPTRPLLLPRDPMVHAQLDQVTQYWHRQMVASVNLALKGDAAERYQIALPEFISKADLLVHLIEVDNAQKTFLLRLLQVVLLVIAIAGAAALIYLVYQWIILPISALRSGVARMADRDFSVSLPVQRRDEFGELSEGFNLMAKELKSLYVDLERRAEEKTQQLALRNASLSALYEMAAFLSQPREVEEVCRGFLDRIMRQFKADGGTIRTLDPRHDNLRLVLAQGLSATHEQHESCIKAGSCFCGQATRSGTVSIQDVTRIQAPEAFHCFDDGFHSLNVFQIMAQDEVLGSFSLHFKETRKLSASERHLLETLGKHLGVALQNRRLLGQTRQLAMEQERNLFAQGLHDSIAQGLNFLNLQLQMLDQSLKNDKIEEAKEILPLLRAGVDESYQDVRELLSNFRSKLGEGELLDAVCETIERFQRQVDVLVELDTEGLDEGTALTQEQQLQVLFILQEALSNVRKHAHASKVQIQIHEGVDFTLQVIDDGMGYDESALRHEAREQLGRRIMKERAARIGATLEQVSTPGQGAKVSLVLPILTSSHPRTDASENQPRQEGL
ncbi:HAMP domain-containing protein [Alcaligenaceae bacterium 429]|nr:HAMP domain-containing protein [Alcaligenaceae bacterium 429]